MKRAITFISLVVIIFFTSVFTPGCGCERSNQLEYRVSLLPVEGETLSNVKLYLPFPHYKKKIPKTMLNAIEKDRREFRSEGKYDVVHTPYGDMLKVQLTGLYRGGGGVSGTYGFKSGIWYEVADDYPLAPVVKQGSNEKTYVYADFEGGSGLYLHIRYDAGRYDIIDLPLPLIDYAPSRTTVKVVGSGLTQTHGQPTSWEKDSILIKKGWNEVPVWTIVW